MPNSANTNASSTGTTSAAARPPIDETADPTADKIAAAGSEAEYLAEQSAAASAAMRGALCDLRANLHARWEQATDVQCWIQRHPWFAVGAASAAGFTAAAVVTPSAGESLTEKLSRTVEAVMGEPDSANGEGPADEGAANRRRAADRRVAPTSIWAMMLEPVVDILKVALQNYVIAAMAGQAAAAAQAASAEAAVEPDNEPAQRPGSANRASDPIESTETNASAMA